MAERAEKNVDTRMTYIKEKIVKRYCPECDKITDHYTIVHLCYECFSTNLPDKKEQKQKPTNKQYSLY